VQRWLKHWYGLKPREASPDALEMELQKIYDSEINITIRIRRRDILVALGNDFTGFDAKGKVSRMSDVLPWLQRAIHEGYRASKYQRAAKSEHNHLREPFRSRKGTAAPVCHYEKTDANRPARIQKNSASFGRRGWPLMRRP
jgi:hypothetical protein